MRCPELRKNAEDSGKAGEAFLLIFFFLFLAPCPSWTLKDRMEGICETVCLAVSEKESDLDVLACIDQESKVGKKGKEMFAKNCFRSVR